MNIGRPGEGEPPPLAREGVPLPPAPIPSPSALYSDKGVRFRTLCGILNTTLWKKYFVPEVIEQN